MISRIACFVSIMLCVGYSQDIASAQQNDFTPSEEGPDYDSTISMQNDTNTTAMNANPGDASMMNANPGDASMMNANSSNNTGLDAP